MSSSKKSDRKTINIQVLGIGFPNKGAELMLASINQWAQDAPFPFRVILPWDSNFNDRLRYNAWCSTYTSNTLDQSYLGKLFNALPTTITRKLGIIKEKDIDVILDASGYGYSDHWGAQKAYGRTGKRITSWKKSNKAIIFLPQAFGPFENKKLREIISTVINNADRIYARDNKSYLALKDINKETSNISVAPDITCLNQAATIKKELIVGVIPNRMAYEGSKSSVNKEDYIHFIDNLIKELDAKKISCELILHEGSKDKELCTNLKNKNPKIKIFESECPLTIKSRIASRQVIVTSRFHGFASAIFSGVPTMATSWSHKYEELANDFKIKNSIITELDPKRVATQIEILFHNPETQITKDVVDRVTTAKQQTNKLWEEINTIINKKKKST